MDRELGLSESPERTGPISRTQTLNIRGKSIWFGTLIRISLVVYGEPLEEG